MHIEKLLMAYPGLKKEFIVKVEALRRGVRISSEACERARERKAYMKGGFIFTQDRTESEGGASKPHFFMFPTGGVCQLRYDRQSAYSIELIDDRFMFCENNEPVTEIDIPPAHELYHKKLSDGTPLRDIIGVIKGDGSNTSVLDGCYWGEDLCCAYCDMVPHMLYKKQHYANYIPHKKPEQVAEALELLWNAGLTHGNFTGGAIPGHYEGKTDVEFYLEYLEAISRRKRFPKNFAIALIAKTKEELKRIHATGIKLISMNLEVWDPGLFAIICPGKNQVIGRDRWMQSLIDAVDIFGVGHVITNFVAGIEMCQPYGFKDIDSALKSTLSGYEYLMQRGIVPRQDYWCIEQDSRLGGHQIPPPSDFFIRLSVGCFELLQKYNLPPSPWFCKECNQIDPIHDLY